MPATSAVEAKKLNVTKIAKRRWLPRPRVSLLSFLLLTLTASSVLLLWSSTLPAWRQVLYVPIGKRNVRGGHDRVPSAGLSNDKSRIFAINMDGFCFMFDAHTGQELWHLENRLNDELHEPIVLFFRNDRFVALRFNDLLDKESTMVVNTESGQLVEDAAIKREAAQLSRDFKDRSYFGHGYAISPDGSRRIQVDPGWEGSIGTRLWSKDNKEIAAFTSNGTFPRGVAFSRDSKTFVTADRWITVRSAEDGRELELIKPVPGGRCYAVVYSKDETAILVTRYESVLLFYSPEPWLASTKGIGLLLTVLFASALIVSLWRDARRLR